MEKSRKQWASGAALAAALVLCGANARAQDSLCRAGERVVFSCSIGKKMVSLCRPAAAVQALVYRFGAPARVELAYPEPGSVAPPAFTQDTSPQYGGGVTTVAFERGEYRYAIYSKVGRSEDTGSGADRYPEFEDGIVISRKGVTIRKAACDDGGDGFREDLDWLPQAKRQPSLAPRGKR